MRATVRRSGAISRQNKFLGHLAYAIRPPCDFSMLGRVNTAETGPGASWAKLRGAAMPHRRSKRLLGNPVKSFSRRSPQNRRKLRLAGV